MKKQMKFIVFFVALAMIMLPAVFLGGREAFGYGGGGGMIIAPPVTPPATPNVTPVVAPTVTTPTFVKALYEGELPAAAASADKKAEDAAKTLYVKAFAQSITASSSPVVNFIAYGTENTKKIGAGERAGVVASYNAAFKRMPTTDAQWTDVIKIANGRWPSETNAASETKAKVEFKKIYKRDAVMSNPNDNAAVTVMAYGLRPANRNLNSEKAAINSFRAIYKKAPTLATDWDSVRAIAYSGAKR